MKPKLKECLAVVAVIAAICAVFAAIVLAALYSTGSSNAAWLRKHEGVEATWWEAVNVKIHYVSGEGASILEIESDE